MSTATVNVGISGATGRAGAVVRRFMWKEYRMHRGLWLAVAVIGAIVQLVLSSMMPPATDRATTLFITALAAAALYGVGAAATTFSVEHEEETHGFLVGLPTMWWPMFAGKLFVAASSAALLAVVLSIVGWYLDGVPHGHDSQLALGVFGMAIVEAVAWGTLFSLLVKRPLVAAILTLLVGSVAVNMAVNAASSDSVGSIVPRAYVQAIPLRLTIVAGVIAWSVLVARRWLATTAPAMRAAQFRLADFFARLRKRSIANSGTAADRGTRQGVTARLLWQTWRESWKLLPLPLLVAAALWIGIAAVVGVARAGDEVAWSVLIATLHFVPALYGAMAFHADQRRSSYRFLAEHAAWPRYVWLARHIVWLGALVLLYVVVAAGIAVVMSRIAHEAVESMNASLGAGQPGNDASVLEVRYELARFGGFVGFAIHGLALAALGMLSGYAIGQLCSMLMRSEILASFLALVVSVLLSAWVVTLFAWRLSGWFFLLPVAVGLFAATWLRAPSWIAGRNEWRVWMRPIAAVVVPVVAVAFLLPLVRLEQVPAAPSPISESTPLTSQAREFIAAARQTAEDYIQVAERLTAGPSENLLERWESPGRPWTPGGFLEKMIPADELDEFRAAERKQIDLARASFAEAVAAGMELSKRPYCLFEFEVDLVDPNATGDRKFTLEQVPLYLKVRELQLSVLLASDADLAYDKRDVGKEAATTFHTDDFLERALAALRMSAHLRHGQPSAIFLDQLRMEQLILHRIGEWAQKDGWTKEELQQALSELNKHFHTAGPQSLSPEGALMADSSLVREVLLGKKPSLALAASPDSLSVQLAYLANKLSWERERALRSLDQFTSYNCHDAQVLMRCLRDANAASNDVRRVLQSLNVGPSSPGSAVIFQPATGTSYLARFEYQKRCPIQELIHTVVDTEVYRRATILQIALAMYRLDHDEYPAQLANLVPNYLPELPSDPYSVPPPYPARSFEYEPHGLELPLQLRNLHWLYGSMSQIKPRTPLLWSVGAGDAQLRRWDQHRYDVDDDDPHSEPRERMESVYMLSNRNGDSLRAPIVFALRKSD